MRKGNKRPIWRGIQIATDKPVVVYCASGFRAALSLSALQIAGYTNVRSFPPSYAGWEAAQ